jgi:hypothetical protein
MKIRRCKIRLVLLGLAAFSAVAGCNTTEIVSERGLEDKVERLRVGETNRSETEALLGPANSVERNRLTYYFADTEFGVGIRRYTPPSGALPIAAGAFPSNTRGVITVSFNDAGSLKQVAVERYFEPPFINDYTYLIKDAAKEPLDAIAQIAAANGFKALDMNKGNGTVTLQDNETKAQIRVILAGQALRLISSNPHSRLSSEYRLYARRQSNVTSAIASAEWVQ